MDSDATDDDGNGCDYYTLYLDECGEYDSSNFIASDECCACGGGGSSFNSSSTSPSTTEFDWYSADFENPIYDTYLMEAVPGDYYGYLATFDQSFQYWFYSDSNSAYCQLTAVLDATGNPEVFYVSPIPIEGFE